MGCLSALEEVRDEVRLEVLVIDRLGPEVREEVRRRFPWVAVHATEPGATIPEMRAVAFRHATGRAVAVIEDHVLVEARWGRCIVDALDSGAAVVGGPIENAATESLIDWAAFLCEYSHCVPPLAAGPASWLPGNNVAYRRELLERFRATAEAGHWEGHLHARLQREGVELTCHPDLVVRHRKHYTFTEYLGQRYLYSRSYAGTRLAAAAGLKRLVYGLAALGLPPVLLCRLGRRALATRRLRSIYLKCLPLIAVFVTSWALGETVGYWFGAGGSMSRVR